KDSRPTSGIRALKNGAPAGTSATIRLREKTSSLAVRSSAVWRNGVTGWRRSNRSRCSSRYAWTGAKQSGSAQSSAQSSMSAGPSSASCATARRRRTRANSWVARSPRTRRSRSARAKAWRRDNSSSEPSSTRSTRTHGRSVRSKDGAPPAVAAASPVASVVCVTGHLKTVFGAVVEREARQLGTAPLVEGEDQLVGEPRAVLALPCVQVQLLQFLDGPVHGPARELQGEPQSAARGRTAGESGRRRVPGQLKSGSCPPLSVGLEPRQGGQTSVVAPLHDDDLQAVPGVAHLGAPGGGVVGVPHTGGDPPEQRSPRFSDVPQAEHGGALGLVVPVPVELLPCLLHRALPVIRPDLPLPVHALHERADVRREPHRSSGSVVQVGKEHRGRPQQ